MSHPVLHVQMLGGFSLHLGNRTLGPIPPKAASVLAHLIINRDRPLTRDLLAGRFWSELADDLARKRLSNALWQIRSVTRAAGLELVEKTMTPVELNPDVELTIDVDIWERRLDAFERRYRDDRRSMTHAELSAIVDSYRGDLLAGYYDEWISEERDRLRSRYLEALAQLVRLTTSDGDYDNALRHARALVAAEPLAEEWQRELLRLLALTAQPSAAERHYQQFKKHLEAELHIAPAAETVNLIEAILDDAASPPVGFPSPDEEPLPFIGRGNERSALLNRVIDLANGKGGIVLIEGEPGIGKSRLAEEVAKGAEWRGAQVLVGCHSETSPMTPYHGLKEALAPATSGLRSERLAGTLESMWLRQAASILEGLSPNREAVEREALQPSEEPWRTTEALAKVILAQGVPKPAVLILEDVHWADEDTMAVLVQLGDRLLESQVLVVLTYQLHEAQRSQPIWNGLSQLEAKPGSSRFVVPPLQEDEVRDLVVAQLGPGRIPQSSMAQLTRTTAGNPYVILELLQGPLEQLDEELYEEAPMVVADGLADQVPLRLADIISRRIDSTTEAVQSVLEGVSAMSGPASSEVVAHVAGLGRPATIDALEQAVALGFLVETEHGCDFAQLQTRRAVYDGIAIERRSGLHGRIVDALALVDEEVPPEQLAHHAWLAGQWQRAYQYHSLAAESALRINAFQTAAEHFAKADHAARSAGMTDGSRVDDLFEQERVLDILGRRQAQEELLDRLSDVDELDPGAELQLRQRQAWLMAYTDRGSQAARLAADSVDLARSIGHNVGELLTVVGTALAWSGDLAGAIPPLEEAIAELGSAGAPTVAAQLMLGRTHADLHDYDAAHRHLEDAFTMAKEANDVRSQVVALGHLASMWHLQGIAPQAESAYREALELARDIGYRHGEGLNLVNLAAFYVTQGRGGRAVELFEEAGAVFASLGNKRGEAFVKANSSELAHLILGDDATARRKADEAAVHFRSLGNARIEAACLNTLASIDRRGGQRRFAKRRLQEALAKATTGEDRAIEAKTELNLALVELDLGHVEEALEHVQTAGVLRRTYGLESLAAALAAIEARVRVDLGEESKVAALAERVIRSNHPGAELAHLAAWWCALALATVGDEAEAAEQTARAHQLLARNLEGLPEVVVARAWSEVPEHRAILEAREQYFVERATCLVPPADSPKGRNLKPEDLVEVTLTKSQPDDWDIPAAGPRRRRRIVRLLAEAADQGAAPRISDLSVLLGVSDRTIKRDLAELRREETS